MPDLISMNDAYTQAPAQASPAQSNLVSLDDAYGPAPENPHDLMPFLKEQGSGLVNLAKQAGTGLVNAVSHPLDTANEMANSVGGMDAEGVYRAVRNTPLIGTAINQAVTAAHGLPGYLKGGEEGDKQATEAQNQFAKQQKQSDIKHEQEHPLTDFIQKSVGTLALPGGAIAQTAAMTLDAFTKSMGEGNDVLTAMKDARNAAVLVGTALKTGNMLSKAPAAAGRYVAKEAGVSGEAIDRYLANPEAVNGASQYTQNPEALKDLVDSKVSNITQGVDSAQNAVAAAQEAVANTKQVPISLASQIPESLDAQGAKLKGLSDQAFDILQNEGQTFPIADIQQKLADKMDSLKLGGEVVPSVGPDAAAYGVMGKFNDMLNEIGQKLGPDVPAPIVKEIIQQLDDLSKESYSTNAGALSPVAAGKLAQVRRVLNQTLRESSPAYATKMDELAPQVQLVNDMSKVFGNEQSAMNALKAAADPQTPRGYTVRNMLSDFDAANGTDFSQQVSDYYDKPRQTLSDAQKDLSSAQDVASQVNKLGPNSTENTLKAIQGGRNFEARKQLEALDPELAQTVQDTGYARQFEKSTTNGSRKAKIGAGIGGSIGALAGGLPTGTATGAVVGGHIGAAIGGFAGGLADLYGGQAVKSALDAGIQINKIAQTPYIKTIMQAAQQGPKSLAVAHYMLSQSDPGYQALMNNPQNP